MPGDGFSCTYTIRRPWIEPETASSPVPAIGCTVPRVTSTRAIRPPPPHPLVKRISLPSGVQLRPEHIPYLSNVTLRASPPVSG